MIVKENAWGRMVVEWKRRSNIEGGVRNMKVLFGFFFQAEDGIRDRFT